MFRRGSRPRHGTRLCSHMFCTYHSYSESSSRGSLGTWLRLIQRWSPGHFPEISYFGIFESFCEGRLIVQLECQLVRHSSQLSYDNFVIDYYSYQQCCHLSSVLFTITIMVIIMSTSSTEIIMTIIYLLSLSLCILL